jgi:hypothetical protein
VIFKTNKILTILLLLILFVGCASNQNKYARKDYTQGELDDYLSDNYTQGELDDDFLTDSYYPVFPIGIDPINNLDVRRWSIKNARFYNRIKIFGLGFIMQGMSNFKEHLMVRPPIDTKKLIRIDGQMYKPKLIIKLLGPGEAFTGESINYSMSGLKKSEGTYLNGKKDGNWTYWYEVFGQDIIESKGYYKLGNRDGLWEYWYPNGEKREVGNLTNQERVGNWTYYNEDNSLDIVISY